MLESSRSALVLGFKAALLHASTAIFTFLHRGCGVTRPVCRDCFRRNGRCPAVDVESGWD